MGKRFGYRCPKCKYKAVVSGGRNAGMDVATVTIVCLTCRRLHDVVVRDWRTPDLMLNLQELEPRCPKSKLHRWAFWYGGGSCPKCGTPMLDTGLRELWD